MLYRQLEQIYAAGIFLRRKMRTEPERPNLQEKLHYTFFFSWDVFLNGYGCNFIGLGPGDVFWFRDHRIARSPSILRKLFDYLLDFDYRIRDHFDVGLKRCEKLLSGSPSR